MKSLRILAAVVALGLTSLTWAQSHNMEKNEAAKSQEQLAFDQLKALSGSWRGTLTLDPPSHEFDGKKAELTLRTTSMGHALMHEIHVAGRPDDPLTILYMNDGRLMLTHYCDAGNRPRMVAHVSPDGKTVEFDFLDVAGPLEYGHMHHAVFSFVDANHHSEEWTYMQPGDKPVRVHFDLERVQ